MVNVVVAHGDQMWCHTPEQTVIRIGSRLSHPSKPFISGIWRSSISALSLGKRHAQEKTQDQVKYVAMTFIWATFWSAMFKPSHSKSPSPDSINKFWKWWSNRWPRPQSSTRKLCETIRTIQAYPKHGFVLGKLPSNSCLGICVWGLWPHCHWPSSHQTCAESFQLVWPLHVFACGDGSHWGHGWHRGLLEAWGWGSEWWDDRICGWSCVDGGDEKNRNNESRIYNMTLNYCTVIISLKPSHPRNQFPKCYFML